MECGNFDFIADSIPIRVSHGIMTIPRNIKKYENQNSRSEIYNLLTPWQAVFSNYKLKIDLAMGLNLTLSR